MNTLGIIYSHAIWMLRVQGREAAWEACSLWELRTGFLQPSKSSGLTERVAVPCWSQPDGHKPQRSLRPARCRDEREIPYVGGLPWVIFWPGQEVTLYSLRVAHWNSSRRVWALSMACPNILWQAITGRSFRKTLEPSFAWGLSEIKQVETTTPNWAAP